MFLQNVNLFDICRFVCIIKAVEAHRPSRVFPSFVDGAR